MFEPHKYTNHTCFCYASNHTPCPYEHRDVSNNYTSMTPPKYHRINKYNAAHREVREKTKQKRHSRCLRLVRQTSGITINANGCRLSDSVHRVSQNCVCRLIIACWPLFFILEAQDLRVLVDRYIPIPPPRLEEVRIRPRGDPLVCDTRDTDDEPGH